MKTKIRYTIDGRDILLPDDAVVLPRVPRNGYSSEEEARADWYTLAPAHRTKARLAEMLECVNRIDGQSTKETS